MTDLERIKKDVVEMDSRANVCWYDTKVLTKAVRLILEELTADRKTEPQKKEVEWVYNKRERLWYPYSNGELLFKTENSSEYERASEQREHDILYEPTYNEDDGSM